MATGKTVENVKLKSPVRKKKALMLGVDVHQPVRKTGQNGNVRRTVVHEGSGSSAGIDYTTNNKMAVILLYPVFIEYSHTFRISTIELSLHHAVSGAGTDDGRICPGPAKKREGTEQNGLAGSCLPGDNDQTLRKVNVQRVYQNVVPDMKGTKHLPRLPWLRGNIARHFRTQLWPRDRVWAASRNIWIFLSVPCFRRLRP